MKYILDIDYSEEEHIFLKKNNCEVISEIELSKTDFKEIPRRVIKYGRQYIAEIIDVETDEIVWVTLSKWKGVWHLSSCYNSLENMTRGI